MKKANLILPVLTMFVSLTKFISAHAGEDEFSHHNLVEGMMGSFGHGFMWLFGCFFMILIVIALILLILWLVKKLQENNGGHKKK